MRNVQQLTLDYLQTHNVLSLATSHATDLWSAAVFYVNNHFDLYFLSAGHTRHAQNMYHNPVVAGTIQEDYDDWQAIKGIQLEGRVTQIHNEQKQFAIELYIEKFPYVAESPTLQPALARINWYKLTPTRLYFIDNSLGLGHRDLVLGE